MAPPLTFVPYSELGGRPNVIVDGSPAEGTVLTLSHWPHSPVPTELEADLSADIAFAYLDRFDLHGDAEIISNNHFDQDGLVSIIALSDPELAAAHRDLLIDVAAAGDFATYRSRTAARISMVLAAFADELRSPLELGEGEDRIGALYRESLARMPELIEHVEHYSKLWSAEDAVLHKSEEALSSGAVTIEEVPEVDLAVVHVPDDAPVEGGHRFAGWWMNGLHPMAVCNATERLGVLSARGSSYEFCYRYESWVQYRSRRPHPRVDLCPLAAELTELEPTGSHWEFEGADFLIPRLFLVGAPESALTLEVFRERLEAHLRDDPVAWDPYSGAAGAPEPAV